MPRPSRRAVALTPTLGAALAPGRPLAAQPARAVDGALVAERGRVERELQALAVVEREAMVPMRDGVRREGVEVSGPITVTLEGSSSSFPRFDRNLDTGGRDSDQATGVVARNAVHHSRRYPSAVTLTVVPRGAPAPGAR